MEGVLFNDNVEHVTSDTLQQMQALTFRESKMHALFLDPSRPPQWRVENKPRYSATFPTAKKDKPCQKSNYKTREDFNIFSMQNATRPANESPRNMAAHRMFRLWKSNGYEANERVKAGGEADAPKRI